MHITGVNIDNIPPLGNVSFECDEHVNLFIGPNGSGKSTILRAINGLNSSSLSLDAEPEFFVSAKSAYNARLDEDVPTGFFLWVSGDWPQIAHPNRQSDSVPVLDAVPLLYIPAVRVGLRGRDILDQTIEEAADLESVDPLIDLFDTSHGIFYGQYVELAIDQLRNSMVDDRDLQTLYGANIPDGLRKGMNFNRSQQAQVRRFIDIGYSCTKSICSEVLYDANPHPFLEVDGYEDSRTVHHGMGIGTNDNILGEPLYAGALSSGTQGTLLWIYALALKMAHHYNWEEGWEKKPAILLIDEIENHLHPTWQRRVIPALKKHFPRLQIFATTHSPFVVAGLRAGQVHLLKRDPENGVVTATTNDRDVIGWTADEILRNMMGVDEPTDQLTVDRVNRLRWLREKGTLSPEEKSELNDLRRQVNEDLLAKGGPLEVERERYADLMRQFIASRQSDLTQDGK